MQYYRLKQRSRPGKILSVMNHKGGTAKSTSLELLSLLRAKATGIPPLVVDFDSQMNLSSALRHQSSVFAGNVGHVISSGMGDWSPSQIEDNVCAIKFKGFGTPIHLVPGTLRLDEPMAALETANRREEGVVFRLRDALHHVRDFYEYIFIDTSPAVGALPGDLALHAADVLLVPVGGLRSILGLVEVLRRTKRHARDRRNRALAPIQVLIYAPHVLTDRTVEPFGAFGVRNGDWYPYLCQTFPDHFVQQVVGHSIQLPRAFKADNSLRALQGERRAEYQAMADSLFAKIEKESIPFLGSQLLAGEVDLEQIEARVKQMIVAQDRQYKVKNVKYQRAVEVSG